MALPALVGGVLPVARHAATAGDVEVEPATPETGLFDQPAPTARPLSRAAARLCRWLSRTCDFPRSATSVLSHLRRPGLTALPELKLTIPTRASPMVVSVSTWECSWRRRRCATSPFASSYRRSGPGSKDRFVVCAEATTDAELPSQMDHLTVFEPHNGWTTVVWPTYFLHYDEIAGYLSARLRAVVPSVSVYHSESWQHVVFDNGNLVDAYSTDPSLLATDLDDPREVARRWRGNPDAVARHVGGRSHDVARHYRRNRRRRSFDDWGFADLWEDVGIFYPVSRIAAAAILVLPERWENALRPTA
jgi:hypothetical protein